MSLKIIRGLKNARFGFTELMDSARNGDTVVVVEIGHDRKTNIGYKMVRMTDAELMAALNNDPSMTIPKPSIPQPDFG